MAVLLRCAVLLAAVAHVSALLARHSKSKDAEFYKAHLAHQRAEKIRKPMKEHHVHPHHETAVLGHGNYSKYHTSADIISAIEKLRENCGNTLIHTEWLEDKVPRPVVDEAEQDPWAPSIGPDGLNIPKYLENGKIFVVHVGGERAKGKSREKIAGEHNYGVAKKSVLVVANEHARELITAEVALRFLETACTGTHENMLKDVRFTVVPVVNKDGRMLVEDGSNNCQRYTPEGTDLNRNMDVDWGQTTQERPGGQTSQFGKRPFSAYQSRLLKAVAEKVTPTAFVDLHSGGERSLLTNYGFISGENPDYEDQIASLGKVQEKHCSDCRMGSARDVVQYENPGCVIDHMYEQQRVKYTGLFEMYQGKQGSVGLNANCIPLFNPTDDEYDYVVDNWSNALFTFGDYINQEVHESEKSSLRRPSLSVRPASLVQTSKTQPPGLHEETL